MAVVLGEADIYLHTGGQYEWDNAAPVAVAVAAGYGAAQFAARSGAPSWWPGPEAGRFICCV